MPRILTYPKISVPTSSLVVTDLSKDQMDGQIAACVLQGIVNRQCKQKIYVMNTYCYDNKSGGSKQAQVAERFLKELFSDIPTERLQGTDDRDWSGLFTLLDRFGGFIKGMIIWDPKLEQATIEAATTVAGQTDGIVVSPVLAEALRSRNLPVIADLRDYDFQDNLECLQWLMENWLDGACKDIAFTWSHMTTDGKSWGAANKDYVVALKLFTFYLDITNDEERKHYIDLLKYYPPGTPVMGWTDERWSDALFMQLGYFMVPYISVENLTVQSSFPSTSGKQPDPHPLEVHNDGVYIAFHVADGDNLLHSMVYEPDIIMNSSDYGKIPVTWVINPGIVDLAPRLFDWYFAKLGTQEIAAQVGDGHPRSDRSTAFKLYCDISKGYLQRAGVWTIKQMEESEAVAWNLQPYVMNSGYNGERRGIGPYEYHMDNETLHIGSVNLKDAPENIRMLVHNATKDQPLFLNVFCGTAVRNVPAIIKKAAEMLKSMERSDGKRYFFVRSMDMAATYRRWKKLPILPYQNLYDK